MHAKRLDPIILHHQCAVVPSRAGIEKAVEKFFADLCVQRDPMLQKMPLYRLAPRQDHQGPASFRGQLIQPPSQRSQTGEIRARSLAAQTERGDLLKEPAQIILEYHH